jgi:hypothetical protein
MPKNLLVDILVIVKKRGKGVRVEGRDFEGEFEGRV